MEILRFGKQKRIAHKYARWMYSLLADGSFYNLPMAKKIHDLPKEYSYRDIEDKPVRFFERIYHCADILDVYYNKKTGESFVNGGIFCGHRICPICAIKKSLKEYSKVTFQMEQFQDKYDYFMLTLTLPNNPDGFRDELKLMSTALTRFLKWFGYTGQDTYHDTCSGAYGSFEVTKSAHGWHPHLHLVLAVPKEYVKDFNQVTRFYGDRKRNFVNNLVLQASERGKKRVFNNTIIMDKWIELVKSLTHKYDERLEDLHFLNIGFEKCYDIDKGRNELTKYLIDFEALESPLDLYVYLRDSYGVKQRVRRGCFIWTEQDQENWDRSFAESRNFIQSEEWVRAEAVFEKHWYFIRYYDTYLDQVPFTNTYKEKTKLVVVKLE